MMSHPEDSPILIGPYGVTVYVTMQDTDPVSYYWAETDIGVFSEGETTDGYTQVTLSYDSNLNGDTLSCVLSDGYNDQVILNWLLEVL